MSRVKRGPTVKQRHKKLLASVKGYRGSRNRSIRKAQESFLHSGEYAFAGRKLKKRNFRSLWINRISTNSKKLGVNYRDFIHGMKLKKILLNRKVIANLVAEDIESFNNLVRFSQNKGI